MADDPRRLTLEQMRAFLAVVEDGGFHHAGTRLHRSQAAITHRLQALEEVLQCQLVIRRQGRVTRLTEAGQRFLHHARDVLDRVDAAMDSVRRDEFKGKLRVGVPDDFAIEHLIQAVRRCVASNMRLQLDVVSDLSARLSRMMEENALDLAFIKRLCRSRGPGRGGVRIVVEPLLWVADREVALADFDEVPLVVFSEGCVYREAAATALARIRKPWRASYSSTSYETVRRAVSAGLGVGILPRSALAPGHCILDAQRGFPPLPEMELTAVVAPHGQHRLASQVAAYIARTCATPWKETLGEARGRAA
ncbi:LysR family transcriptional regulator [Rhodovastum atsumiense]|uniref:LysR family transcriptional regulator n=1 Tax=Rhodovastum atsumiense TaxID=504468 RepID=A0A5M6IZB8_9PROT|nr:LysR substrate-binding domain-containing protein [Rhodovastum atsumiense]KAA5612698.1 LysR family transcriptional regulator [Rhodovastum atsumiense]CAH2602752.1 LysR family transcriptional regulator [Rhodovastum atsumiense]